jgi:sugar phosphate isomerase/epimerase
MKIAYGTYAMPKTRLEEAIPLLRTIGYDGVEICVSPKHLEALPADFSSERRQQVRELLVEHRLAVPAMMVIGAHLWAPDDDQNKKNLHLIRDTARLARDFGVREPVVVSVGIGGKTANWSDDKLAIIKRLKEYADQASADQFIIAAEAHCGAAVDRSERAVEVIQAVDRANLRLHFDIVHFFLAGEAIEDSVQGLVPITAHTHITDTRRHADGTFDFHILGDGELDSTAYMRAMDKAGWDDFITLEVSARVWSRDGYDSDETARRSYAALKSAFDKAGVSRD